MSRKHILIVVGTRPNFIKVTRFKSIAKEEFPQFNIKIAHTNQHFDASMADVFFKQFNLVPDFVLPVKPNRPVKQMAQIMTTLDELLEEQFSPDLMIVPGDVNSTLAAALVANKRGIRLAHLESGLRSFDQQMPEEWNRIVTDTLSNIHFVTESSGQENLKREGFNDSVYMVGNTMIDTLVHFKPHIQASGILETLSLSAHDFVLMTIHRPSNVDQKEGIEQLMEILEFLQQHTTVVFPIHPRTRGNIEKFGMLKRFQHIKRLKLIEPLGYMDFQKLIASCTCVLTDSGGIQEETTFLQKPCLTLRNNTERPVTIEKGTNTLVPFKSEDIIEHLTAIFSGSYKQGVIPDLWDGNATHRILTHLDRLL
jgi:UDP-N-acetylglucosamine 2-epimerase (non-hydrolysing)